MKYVMMIVCVVLVVLWSTQETYAQAIYGPQGQYLGYQQTGNNGVTSTYTPQGNLVGTQQVDNGQTSYYGAQGQYQGTSTAPVYMAPNSTISTPRQAPQVPQMKGW